MLAEAAGESLALPPEVVGYLHRVRELGFPERMIEIERDSWILIAAHSPERVPELMAEKRRQIEDPEILPLYRALGEAIDWAPDDPRLPFLADRIAAMFDQSMAADDNPGEEKLDEDIVELLDSALFDAVPLARRLVELLEERGWSGWTQLKPADK